MSDTTTLREACLHDRYDSHALGWLSPELIEPEYIKRQFDGKGWLCDCPGGRERTFHLKWAHLTKEINDIGVRVLVEVTDE